jgi:hypothetical protein
MTKTLYLLSFFLFFLVESVPTPCIIWKNSFVEITPSTTNINNTKLFIKVKTRQTKGWISVGVSKSNNSFQDSLFIVALIPNQILVFKNHTEIDTIDKIFDISLTQNLRDTIDGLYSFSFSLNSSQIIEKNFIFFASNESPPRIGFNSLNQNLTLPKHNDFSTPRFFDLKDTNIEYPVCDQDLNFPGRILARNWITFSIGTTISVALIVLYVYFRNDQPLKSRFVAPIIGTIGLTLNLSAEFFLSMFTFEEQTVSKCKHLGFLIFPFVQLAIVLPALIMMRYSVLLQLHFLKKDFINNQKALKRKTSNTFSPSTKIMSKTLSSSFNSKLKQFQQKPNIVYMIQQLRKVLLVLQSQWVLLVIPFVWVFLFESIVFFIVVFSEFQCKPWTRTYITNLHFFGLLLFTSFFLVFFIIDIILSLRNILRCRWKKYIEEDPFQFRYDFAVLVPFVPFLILWVFFNFPNAISTSLSDILFALGTMLNGGWALIITISRKLIFLIKSNNMDNTRLKLNIDIILKDENLLEKFIEFSEFEWSSENIYFKIDVSEYKKKNDNKSKKAIADQIKENYLIRNVSPLEINVTKKALNPTLIQIEQQSITIDMFDFIEREVDVNICDTLSRFIISSQYNQYLKENENPLKSLGL